MSTRVLHCPICRKPVALDDPGVPFCSDRCRTQDLANWADEKYVISTPRANGEPDDSERLAEPGESVVRASFDEPESSGP